MDILEILFIGFVFAMIAGMVASAKGRNSLGWFLLCFFLTPLFLIVLLVLPKIEPSPGKIAIEEATKACPQCAERVKAAAKICHFCRYEFPVVDLAALEKAVTANPTPSDYVPTTADRVASVASARWFTPSTSPH
jgi:hypothetical protein